MYHACGGAAGCCLHSCICMYIHEIKPCVRVEFTRVEAQCIQHACTVKLYTNGIVLIIMAKMKKIMGHDKVP